MRKLLILIGIVLLIFNRSDTNFKQVKFNDGFGVEFENGKILTAFHLIKDNDKIIYSDIEKDIAVVQLFESNKNISKSLVVKNNCNSFLYIDWLINKGDSGKPYIKNGKLAGIFIGRKGNKAVVSTLSDDVIKEILN